MDDTGHVSCEHAYIAVSVIIMRGFSSRRRQSAEYGVRFVIGCLFELEQSFANLIRDETELSNLILPVFPSSALLNVVVIVVMTHSAQYLGKALADFCQLLRTLFSKIATRRQQQNFEFRRLVGVEEEGIVFG